MAARSACEQSAAAPRPWPVEGCRHGRQDGRMDSRRAKAEKWKANRRRGIEIVMGAVRRGARLADKGHELYLFYTSLGWCELVLSESPEPARLAFNTALQYWFFCPSDPMAVQAQPLLEVAILAHNPEVRRRVVDMIRPSPPDWEDWPAHLVGSLLLTILKGEGGGHAERRKLEALQGDRDYKAYGQMLGAVMDGDARALREGARLYLAEHHRAATRGDLRDVPYGLVAAPVLAALALARERGLHVAIEDPYVPMHALN